MGSGNSNRKDSDTIVMRAPKQFSELGLGANFQGNKSIDACIPSFESIVNNTNLSYEGAKVYLDKMGSKFSITLGGTTIGTLNLKLSTMIMKCQEMGIRYSGEIIIHKNNTYARFTRIL